MNWRQLVSEGKYAEAEAAMLAETDRGVGMFPENEIRASFYENWGDVLGGDEDKYREAANNWQQFASCATSGGEGTARMLDVNRVLKKIKGLKC
ncbi:MAG TPA: hypothetical protein PKD24_13795 [Pyrinomonadaceae bacterium]|nr:hypothetical protein [Pyrinomonadaceae bacterium]HMP66563.1 hypothetical protein [Pyrinomonadaceae bacterium]